MPRAVLTRMATGQYMIHVNGVCVARCWRSAAPFVLMGFSPIELDVAHDGVRASIEVGDVRGYMEWLHVDGVSCECLWW